MTIKVATQYRRICLFGASVLISITLASKGIRDRCPPYEILQPCFCNSIPNYHENADCSGINAITYRCQAPIITCIGTGLTNLGQILFNVTHYNHNIKFRKFEWFYLVDSEIAALENGWFRNIYFRNIYLQSCPNLLVIHADTFGTSGLYVQNIFINASRLSDKARLKRSTFKALSGLSNLQVLEIQMSSFTSIPYKAFNRNNNIQIIRFYNPDVRQYLRKINSKAFYKANEVREIDLKNNHISSISQYAFQFHRAAKHEVKIFLGANSLHSDSFDRNAFNGGNGRSITLYLGHYGGCNSKLQSLKQDVFESFLMENPSNVIDMYGCPLVCDKQMTWLTHDIGRYPNQIRNLVCYNRTDFISNDNYNYYHISY